MSVLICCLPLPLESLVLGKKSMFQKVIKSDSVCVPVQIVSVLQTQYLVAVESGGCKAMVSLFKGP
jgi:hypothetical protein